MGRKHLHGMGRLLIQSPPILVVENDRQRAATEHVSIHFHLGQCISELLDRCRRRLVD
jgi:hypothetical protein